MKYYSPFISVLFYGTVLFSSPAQAQLMCGPHADVTGKLSALYDERQTAIGMARNGQLLEIFVADDGTWTILLSRPDGVTCLMISGDHWQETREPAKTVRQES